jgi:predicted aspartyl protease
MNESWNEPEMTECESIEFDISIAKHNVWVARTELESREEDLEILNAKLYKLQFSSDSEIY